MSDCGNDTKALNSSRSIFTALDTFLKKNKTLETLELSQNNLTADQVALFSEGVSQSTIKRLDVDENKMGTAGFCNLLDKFKGEVFNAHNAMGAVKKEDRSATEQVCRTIMTNPHVTELLLYDVSPDSNSDAKIFGALEKNKRITKIRIIADPSERRELDNTAITAICALLEAKTALNFFSIDLYLGCPPVESSFLKNNRILYSHGYNPSFFGDSPEVKQKFQENREKVFTENYNCGRLAAFIAFVRANQLNPLCNSMLPVIPMVSHLAGWKNEFAEIEKEGVKLRAKLSGQKT